MASNTVASKVASKLQPDAADAGASGVLGRSPAGEAMTPVSSTAIRFCDISALGKLRISGPAAHDFIRIMCSAELGALDVLGGVQATLLLTGDAEMIDVVLVIRTGDNEYMLTTNEETLAEVYTWLRAHALISDDKGKVFEGLEISDETEQLADIVLFGAGSTAILSELALGDFDASPHTGALRMVQLDTVPVLLLNTPVLRGEAFEIFCPRKQSAGIINALMSFPELEPMDIAEYVRLRKQQGTWFLAAGAAEYVHPDTAMTGDVATAGDAVLSRGGDAADGDAAGDAAGVDVRPTARNMMHLVRADMDFVGAKALAERVAASGNSDAESGSK